MKSFILLIICLNLADAVHAAENNLLGKWKSNEKKTLESMRETQGITDKAKVLFENDFFGKLIIDYKNDTYQARFDNSVEELNKYYPYKILEVTTEHYLIEGYDALLEEFEKKMLFWEGECYFVYTSKWNFKEYFCRLH